MSKFCLAQLHRSKIFFSISGIGLMIYESVGIGVVVLIGTLIISAIYFLRNIYNKPAVIILNNNGLEFNNEQIPWDKVYNTRVTLKTYANEQGIGVTRYLYFQFRDKDNKMRPFERKIDNLNIGQTRLEYLIYIYRNRFEKLTTANINYKQ